MTLYLYQYQAVQDFSATLATYNIQVTQSYWDCLEHRPALFELLENCRHSSPGYVLIESATTLADDHRTFQQRLESFWDCQVGLVLMNPDPIQSDKFAPLLMVPSHWSLTPPELGVLSSIRTVTSENWLEIGGQLAKAQRRQNVRRGHTQNRLQGLPPPGKAPYGYRRGKNSYLLDRRAAPVVKGFYEHFLLYGCLRSAVRFVAKNYGKSISVSTAKRWLTHPVYRGHLCYQQSDIISDQHPPLLTPLEAAQVDRLLQRNQRFTTRSVSAPRSLAGLVQCGTCGSGMTISQVTKPQRQYLYLRPQHCPEHPKCPGLAYEEVLQQTIAAICRQLPQAIASFNPPSPHPKQTLESQISQHSEILSQIPTLLENGILDQETAQLRTFKLKTELSQLQQKLSSFPPVNLSETTQTIAISEFWQDLSETERRFYFREFIRAIEITHPNLDGDWGLSLDFVFDSGKMKTVPPISHYEKNLKCD